MSARELIERELDILPEPWPREVYDFVRFLKLKSDEDISARRLYRPHFPRYPISMIPVRRPPGFPRGESSGAP